MDRDLRHARGEGIHTTNAARIFARPDINRESSWRGPLLNATLWVSALLGSVWLSVGMAEDPQLMLSLPGGMIEGLLALAWAAAIAKRFPEGVRLGCLLTFYFGVAGVAVMEIGPIVPAAFILLMLFMLTSMLYGGLRGALAAIAAVTIQYGICAYGWASGILPLRFVPQFNNDPHGVFVWLRAGAGQLMGSAAIAAIVIFVMRHEKQINAALRASEDSARLLLEHAPESVLVLDVESQRFVAANPAAESLFGYSQAELMCKSRADLSPERQPDGRLSRDAAAAYTSAAAAGVKSTFEWTHRNAQGQEFLSEVRLLRLPDPRRVLLRGSVVDITERKRMEQALKESLALLQATLSAAPVGIARLRNRVILDVNGAFGGMMGYQREDLIGQSTRMLHVNDADYRMSERQYSILADRNVATTEMRLVAKDGRIVEVVVNSVWLDAANPDAGVVVAVMDITERNALQQQLRQSQKLEAIGTLAGGIAHDFNNILTGILGFTELSRQVTDGNDEVHEYLDQIKRAGRRAADLVTQIVAFSRSDGTARTPLQMREVVVEAIELLRATIPASIEFDLQLSDDLPMVLANGSQLHQVVVNLGINAAHAMLGRAGKLGVTLAACEIDEQQASALPDMRPGTHVSLRITDTGCGMDDATLQRAFEPFFTTKAPGEGSGLGLSVIHGIVRSHHGAIRLISQVGRGTTVEIFLPATALEPKINLESAESTQSGHGERVLLVDDVESLVTMGKMILRQLGYAPEGESEALRALARIEQDPHHFELVVTDQTMPGMSGLDFAARVRQMRPDLPVVLTSGFSAAISRDQLQAAGVREILAKPYTADDLAAAVHRQLHHQ
jgi:PAS domain S-box-containing protein